MAKDTCIMCGAETPYEFETHIDYRYGYVEGAGQCCRDCYDGKKSELSNDHLQHFLVSAYTVKSTPNDAELGAKVRQAYWEIYGENTGSYADLETYRRGRSKF
jgi:hypothetical protein